MTKPVGFDQKVLLHHLDYTAKQIRKHSKKDMYAILDGFLREDITGAKSRKNAITMLMKIWFNVPENLKKIRDEILQDFNEFTKEERLFMHWCMTMVAYPFFKEVANEFGRLFQLQESVPSTAIRKRMKESYGDRRRVEVATSAVLTSMKMWGVISPSENTSYRENEKITVSNHLLQVLLLQALLNVLESDSLYVDTIMTHPLLFPFDFDMHIHELRLRKSDFIFHYQGVEKLVVERA